MSEQLTIGPLPEETRSKLRATQILTSLPQIVSELLQNALDATATQIDIGVDTEEWTCWVRDDGEGLNKEGLEQLGTNGRYNTSKKYASGFMNSSSTFGFRGEALASAGEIACLEICSRTSKSRNTWSLIIKGGKQLYLGPAVRWKRESSGTTVCIRDAFYNLPVRRRSHSNSSRTWELLQREMECYALVFPHVSFSLDDSSTRGSHSQSHKHSVIRIAKSPSTLNCFKSLYGQALTEQIEEITFASESIKIEGFISLTGASSKAYQFLYINRHPMSMSDFGRTIDSEFSSSSFGKNALDEGGETDFPRSTIRRSPRKLEKKPVYVLNITVAPEDVDNCVEPSKTAVKLRNQADALSCLRKVIRQFLDRHGFYSRNTTAGLMSSLSPSPRKRRKQDYQYVEDSGYAEDDSAAALSELSIENKTPAPPRVSAPLYTSLDAPAEEIVWQDPSTREQFVVDSRTGHSFRFPEIHVRQTCNDHSSTSISGSPSGPPSRRTLRQQISNSVPISSTNNPETPTVPEWLGRALQNNRAYAVPENRIPSHQVQPPIGQSTSRLNSFQKIEHVCHRPPDLSMTARFQVDSLSSGSTTPSFSKEELFEAETIGQVDRKFVACRILRSGAFAQSFLVLVDQHAADERIRVERFLKELCLGMHRTEHGGVDEGPHVRQLIPPLPVLLTRHEALRILQSQEVRNIYHGWGVQFVEASKGLSNSDGDSDSGRSTPYLQLLVSTIPEIISDKLLQGDELRDFIKGILGQIQNGELLSDSHLHFPSKGDTDEAVWLKVVRRCPKVLLDLVNSRACRGAIMFNDALSLDQCEKLVKQLSQTVFPFQCAHGRPSLLSLIETGVLRKDPSSSRDLRNRWARLETMEES
ncbi:hypothetical protein CPB83DRAFT_802764 [Crepidotus variabilis]|uniref:MutL C-terminal dimerisation domain-containing protein n=1 Tax=Crepidotus variabilis TaxID=179855 RepID=A0A9P6ETL9_9AGAR|nr:hypothetical protein CPB83DRAFT_802764 [Crepidotus variabilis]